ncbi:hypothetical protein [Candidatus Nanohalococcus occultus]
MSYKYTCKMCGTVLTGRTEKSLVLTVQNHYVSGHGLQHGSDVEPSGIEFDEEKIRENIRGNSKTEV